MIPVEIHPAELAVAILFVAGIMFAAGAVVGYQRGVERERRFQEWEREARR